MNERFIEVLRIYLYVFSTSCTEFGEVDSDKYFGLRDDIPEAALNGGRRKGIWVVDEGKSIKS